MAANDIIFNEFFTGGFMGMNPYGSIPQWIELYNTTGQNISLCGYKLLVVEQDLNQDQIDNPEEFFSDDWFFTELSCNLPTIDMVNFPGGSTNPSDYCISKCAQSPPFPNPSDPSIETLNNCVKITSLKLILILQLP